MKEFEKRRKTGALDSLDDDIAELERRLSEE
jgi:hypothetical protein